MAGLKYNLSASNAEVAEVGTRKDCIAAIQKAIDINPNSSQYHYVLSQIYRKVGKTKESQQEMEIFKRLWSSSK